MVEIIIDNNLTNIRTNDLQIYIDGTFEIKKEGAEAPIIKVIADEQKEPVHCECTSSEKTMNPYKD